MKTSKSYRLNEHTLYQIEMIKERDECNATEAIEKAVNTYRIMQTIVDDDRFKEERFYTMLKVLLERGV